MADHTIKAGDTGSSLKATLKGAGVAVDLTGASVRFVMSDAQYRAEKVNAAAAITDAPAGAVSYAWAAGDLDTPGQFLGEFEVTFADATVATFPSAGYVDIRIVDDLG